MPKPTKGSNHVKRLAKGLSKGKRTAGNDGQRKGHVRPGAGGDTAGTAADARQLSPLARLIQLLGEEKIRFQVVGMTAAALQGVIMSTLDTDIWVDLPERQYIRLMNICVKLGGTPLA